MPKHDEKHHEANEFACELLMPKEAFDKFIDNVSCDVTEIATHFQVPAKAVCLRAEKLGYNGNEHKIGRKIKNKSITLTVEQLIACLEFAGLTIADEKSIDKDDLEMELVIDTHQKVALDDDKENVYEGMTVHISEYPEEGFLPLEKSA